MMGRREMLGLVAGGTATLLSGCGGENATVRYRVIATAEVDGQCVEDSTVVEVHYSRIKQSLIGAGGGSTLYGEALILDLKGRGTVFILPVRHQNNTEAMEIYEYGILLTLGVTTSTGGLSDDDFARLRQATGRRPFSFAPLKPPVRLSACVAFRDEKVPNTVYEVEPQDMGRSFPGVRFISLDIENTDALVSKILRQKLPWLESPTSSFDRDLPGKLRAQKDQLLGYKITKAHFLETKADNVRLH